MERCTKISLVHENQELPSPDCSVACRKTTRWNKNLLTDSIQQCKQPETVRYLQHNIEKNVDLQYSHFSETSWNTNTNTNTNTTSNCLGNVPTRNGLNLLSNSLKKKDHLGASSQISVKKNRIKNRVSQKELLCAQKVKKEQIDQDQFVYNILEQE